MDGYDIVNDMLIGAVSFAVIGSTGAFISSVDRSVRNAHFLPRHNSDHNILQTIVRFVLENDNIVLDFKETATTMLMTGCVFGAVGAVYGGIYGVGEYIISE